MISNSYLRANLHKTASEGIQWLLRSLGRSRLMLMLLILVVRPASAMENTLEGLSYTALPGDQVQLTLKLATPLYAEPHSFTTSSPARIALDFPDTKNAMTGKVQNVGIGMLKNIMFAEAAGRTRVVLNLVQMVPYETRVDGSTVQLVIGVSAGAKATVAVPKAASGAEAMGSADETSHADVAVPHIKNIEFRRGDEGEGRVVVTLSDASIFVDTHEEAGKISVDFLNSSVSDQLEQRLDVTDFATPVKMIESYNRDGNVHMDVMATGDYDYLAYQADDVYTIELKPFTKEELERKKKQEFVGERLSINFQNIEVRAVLQLIADFTGLNMVVSDTVSGNLTLRLQNVPWDQAMDIILKTKGLDKRQNGNVMLVAPSEEIATREKLELEAQRQLTELEPLHSEFIQINYAKASDIAGLLKGEKNSMLSERGSVTVDERTNTLLVQETNSRLLDIHRLVAKLDVPVRQVLIESRIVIANNAFNKDLGVKFGFTGVTNNGNDGIIGTTGSVYGTGQMVDDAVANINSTGSPLPVSLPGVNDRLNVNLPTEATPGGTIAFALLAADYLLDLELSAMQAEGQGEVVSNPRVVTSDRHEAMIKQGVEIPYQEASSSGATTVSFKEAVLKLKVLPQITPDDRIIMDLVVNKDTPDFSRQVLGTPPLDTREISTQVLVSNGETIVLGGVYEQDRLNSVKRVPLLSDLPLVGALFRSNSDKDDQRELLIFVTPKIIKQSLTTH